MYWESLLTIDQPVLSGCSNLFLTLLTPSLNICHFYIYWLYIYIYTYMYIIIFYSSVERWFLQCPTTWAVVKTAAILKSNSNSEASNENNGVNMENLQIRKSDAISYECWSHTRLPLSQDLRSLCSIALTVWFPAFSGLACRNLEADALTFQKLLKAMEEHLPGVSVPLFSIQLRRLLQSDWWAFLLWFSGTKDYVLSLVSKSWILSQSILDSEAYQKSWQIWSAQHCCFTPGEALLPWWRTKCDGQRRGWLMQTQWGCESWTCFLTIQPQPRM